MVPFEDNELMCRVGAGTPMGEAMRRFWVPACLSAELPEPDGDPIRVELLGDSLRRLSRQQRERSACSTNIAVIAAPR